MSFNSEQDNAFEAVIDNYRHLLKVLSSMEKSDFASIIISEMGIRMTIDKSNCSQLSIFLQKDLFSNYFCQAEETCFKINPKTMIDFLSVFAIDLDNDYSIINHLLARSPQPLLKLRYKGPGFPLSLLIQENSILTECTLSTYMIEPMIPFEMKDEEVANRIIIDSKSLKEVWFDFDAASTELELAFNSNSLRLSTVSPFAKIHYEFSNNISVVYDFLSCKDQTYRYQMQLMKLSYKALVQSSQVSIRIRENGLLSIQFLIRLEDTQNAYAEFFCLPNFETDSSQ